jgi:hypothetical protein
MKLAAKERREYKDRKLEENFVDWRIHLLGERLIHRNVFLSCLFVFFAAIPFMFLG